MHQFAHGNQNNPRASAKIQLICEVHQNQYLSFSLNYQALSLLDTKNSGSDMKLSFCDTHRKSKSHIPIKSLNHRRMNIFWIWFCTAVNFLINGSPHRIGNRREWRVAMMKFQFPQHPLCRMKANIEERLLPPIIMSKVIEDFFHAGISSFSTLATCVEITFNGFRLFRDLHWKAKFIFFTNISPQTLINQFSDYFSFFF